MDGYGFDEEMMRRCLALAQLAEGRTAPNPMVGAVILDRESKFVAEGFHEKAGLPHAEVVAFEKAQERAAGGTLYVNLEPCSHFGRTPPCADRVIKEGIVRVVIGMQDPNPQVSGQGIARLQAAGIKVEFSNLEADCRELNRAFVKRMSTGLPWLSLKIASSLDGRIADRSGESRWISGAQARNFVQQLRNIHDCVLIGGRTAAIDDPELTVREIKNGRNPKRAVVDPSLQVSPRAKLCRHESLSESWTVIFCRSEKIEAAPLYPDGVKLVDPLAGANGTFLRQSLNWLARNEVASILCEGGGRLAAALLEEGLVDEVFWILAPKLFVDAEAVPALSGRQAKAIESCLSLKDFSYTRLGSDILVRGRVQAGRDP